MKNAILVLFFLFFSLLYHAQVVITDQAAFGGSDFDIPSDAVNAPDGGYYVLNYVRSFSSGNVTATNYGEVDFLLVKYDANNTIEWQRSYGGSDYDVPTSIQLINNNLFLVGHSKSPVSGNKTAVNQGNHDVWIVKTDLDGVIIWDKSYGGSENDFSTSVDLTDNENLLIASLSLSDITGNKTSPNIGSGDYWVFELDQNGDYLWQKTIGSEQMDEPRDIVFYDNSIYISGASQGGISGDKTETNIGIADFWIVKANATGDVIWDRTIGTTGWDSENSHIWINADSIQIFCQGSNAMSGLRTIPRKGTEDIWRFSLDMDGNLLSQASYGGDGEDRIYGLMNLNGNLLLSSASNSDASIDKTENGRGWFDFWPVLLNPDGDIIWQKTIGGSNWDYLTGALIRTNNRLLLIGSSDSPISGDKTAPNFGDMDAWIVELDITSLSTDNLSYQDLTVYPNPFKNSIVLSGEHVTQIKKIEIIDGVGKVVYSGLMSSEVYKNSLTISTDEFSGGAYLLNVYIKEGVLRYKLVK